MKISVKFPKGIPFFELKNQQIANMLNDFADTSVTHIKAETKKGKDIDGRKFTKLRSSTAKLKRKKGSKTPTKPLMDTDRMRDGIYRNKTATKLSLESQIKVPNDRQKVASYHLEGSGSLPVRKFFGVGKKLEKKLNKYLGLHLSKIIAIHRKKMKLKK